MDSDALAHITAKEAADGLPLPAAVRAATDAFVIGCKADPSPMPGVSNWDAMRQCHLLAGAQTLAGAQVPLRGLAGTFNNFTANEYLPLLGLKGGGAEERRYISDIGADNLDLQNDASMAFWVSEYAINTSTGGKLGSSTNANGGAGRLMSGPVDMRIQTMLNSGGSGATTTHSADGSRKPFAGMSRHASDHYIRRARGHDMVVQATSTGISSGPIHILRQGNSNGLNEGPTFCDARIAFYMVGRSVDLVALDTRLARYMRGISGNAASRRRIQAHRSMMQGCSWL